MPVVYNSLCEKRKVCIHCAADMYSYPLLACKVLSACARKPAVIPSNLIRAKGNVSVGKKHSVAALTDAMGSP